MSALQFAPSSAKGNGLFEPRNCSHFSCNSAGRHRAFIMGSQVAVLCTKHRNEWERTWDECSSREKVAA